MNKDAVKFRQALNIELITCYRRYRLYPNIAVVQLVGFHEYKHLYLWFSMIVHLSLLDPYTKRLLNNETKISLVHNFCLNDNIDLPDFRRDFADLMSSRNSALFHHKTLDSKSHPSMQWWTDSNLLWRKRTGWNTFPKIESTTRLFGQSDLHRHRLLSIDPSLWTMSGFQQGGDGPIWSRKCWLSSSAWTVWFSSCQFISLLMILRAGNQCKSTLRTLLEHFERLKIELSDWKKQWQHWQMLIVIHIPVVSKHNSKIHKKTSQDMSLNVV